MIVVTAMQSAGTQFRETNECPANFFDNAVSLFLKTTYHLSPASRHEACNFVKHAGQPLT